jgi:hypothetical protein
LILGRAKYPVAFVSNCFHTAGSIGISNQCLNRHWFSSFAKAKYFSF